jgi:hypothetical protein
VEEKRRPRGKLDPARNLWVLGSGQQLRHRHFQVLAGIEPDKSSCDHASKHGISLSMVVTKPALLELCNRRAIGDNLGVKTTRYFEEQILRKRSYLRREWCK